MNKTIMAIMAMLAIMLAPMAQGATADVTVNIGSQTSFEDIVRNKIVEPKNNTCYFYSDKSIMVNDYATATDSDITGPVVRDVTNYKTYSIYEVHDQDTLGRFIGQNCNEVHAYDINGNAVIVFKDLGKCEKTKAEFQKEINSLPVQACLSVYPLTRAYYGNLKAPESTASWVSILGLIGGNEYGRNDDVSAGWNAGGTITSLQAIIDMVETIPYPGSYCITNGCTMSTTFNIGDVPNIFGMDMPQGVIQTTNLGLLNDATYQIISGETATMTLNGYDGNGALVATDSTTFSFEYQTPP